jgi:hypothetical protein
MDKEGKANVIFMGQAHGDTVNLAHNLRIIQHTTHNTQHTTHNTQHTTHRDVELVGVLLCAW